MTLTLALLAVLFVAESLLVLFGQFPVWPLVTTLACFTWFWLERHKVQS